MTTMIQGDQLRALLLGVRVERDADTIPQTASETIFSVTGGRVVLTSLIGEVTTVIGSTTVNFNITHTPTGGSAADLVAATACTSDAVGTLYSLVSGVATDLLSIQNVSIIQSTAAPATDVPNVTFAQLLRVPLLLPAGDIKFKTSASTTGAVKWAATYIPYDNGSAMAAAA